MQSFWDEHPCNSKICSTTVKHAKRFNNWRGSASLREMRRAGALQPIMTLKRFRIGDLPGTSCDTTGKQSSPKATSCSGMRLHPLAWTICRHIVETCVWFEGFSCGMMCSWRIETYMVSTAVDQVSPETRLESNPAPKLPPVEAWGIL